MNYNPHDDEEVEHRDDRPFAPNYRKGRPNTRLRKAQKWDDIFASLGFSMFLTSLLFIGSLAFVIKLDFQWWVYIGLISLPIHIIMLFYAQSQVHKQGFSCPPASMGD